MREIANIQYRTLTGNYLKRENAVRLSNLRSLCTGIFYAKCNRCTKRAWFY